MKSALGHRVDESSMFYSLRLSIDRTTSSIKIQTFIERTHRTQPIGLNTHIVAITNFAIWFTSRGTRDEHVETPNIKYACNFDLRIQFSVLRIRSSVGNHDTSRWSVCFLSKASVFLVLSSLLSLLIPHAILFAHFFFLYDFYI